MATTRRGQPCDMNASLGKTCDNPSLLKPCGTGTCWRLMTVGFDLCPKAISFACHECSRPGVEFHTFHTSGDPDDPAMDVMIRVTVDFGEVCGSTVLVPFHLRNCNLLLLDLRPTYNTWAYVTCRGTQSATRFIAAPNDDCPDICTQLGLPIFVPDPGDVAGLHCRTHPDPPAGATYSPCGNWCITWDGSSQLVPCGSGPSCDPRQDLSDEICYDFSGACTPGPH